MTKTCGQFESAHDERVINLRHPTDGWPGFLFVGCWGNGHVAGETQSSSRKKKVKTQGRAGVEKVDGLVYGSPTYPPGAGFDEFESLAIIELSRGARLG